MLLVRPALAEYSVVQVKSTANAGETRSSPLPVHYCTRHTSRYSTAERINTTASHRIDSRQGNVPRYSRYNVSNHINHILLRKKENNISAGNRTRDPPLLIISVVLQYLNIDHRGRGTSMSSKKRLELGMQPREKIQEAIRRTLKRVKSRRNTKRST